MSENNQHVGPYAGAEEQYQGEVWPMLTDVYNEWCEIQGYGNPGSADELVCEILGDIEKLDPTYIHDSTAIAQQRENLKWLEHFIALWEYS